MPSPAQKRRQAQLAALAGELARRKASERVEAAAGEEAAAKLRDWMHPKQRAFFTSDASRKAALCTRRVGKTSGGIKELAARAATTKNGRFIYINTTFAELENVAWRGNNEDGFTDINEVYRLGGVPNHTKLRMWFPATGSIIRLVPADNLRSIRRLLGGAFHVVWVDEAQKMLHVQKLIESILGPAMMDHGGELWMTGTPDELVAGYFYEVTKRVGGVDDEPMKREAEPWEAVGWSVLDNPFFGKTREERYARTIERYCRENGLDLDDPRVQREWFGRWIKEDAHYVYHVHKVPGDALLWDAPEMPRPEKSPYVPHPDEILPYLPKRPDGRDKSWLFALGVDMGYDPDPFAYVLRAFSYEDECDYELASWKKNQLIPDEMAAILTQVNELWRPIAMACDAGGYGAKALVKGWERGWLERYPLPVIPAEKQHKATAIEWQNNDIRQRRVKYRPGSPLLEELRSLVWVVNALGQYIGEDKRTGNHLADADLYGRRWVRSYRGQNPAAVKPGTPEFRERQERRIAEEVGWDDEADDSLDPLEQLLG